MSTINLYHFGIYFKKKVLKTSNNWFLTTQRWGINSWDIPKIDPKHLNKNPIWGISQLPKHRPSWGLAHAMLRDPRGGLFWNTLKENVGFEFKNIRAMQLFWCFFFFVMFFYVLILILSGTSGICDLGNLSSQKRWCQRSIWWRWWHRKWCGIQRHFIRPTDLVGLNHCWVNGIVTLINRS